MSNFRKVDINENSLGLDAWGKNKMVQDSSLFHGVFTYDVPARMWIEHINRIEQPTKVNCVSEDGMLKISSNGSNAGLRSKRHPRYQPNRGHLYSTSMIFPNPTADGKRDFGLGNENNAVFFRVAQDGLHCIVRTTAGGITVDDDSGVVSLPDIDLSKGNVFDIQMQWRGVGNIKFFINLKLVYEFEYLGTLDALSIANQALAVGFYCQKVTEDVVMYCGCVDVTSEGGVQESRQYNSVTTGMDVTALTASKGTIGTATIAITLPEQFNGQRYTRDAVLNLVTTFTKDEATTGIYYFRFSAGASSLALYNGILADQQANDSYVRYSIGGDGSTLNTNFNTALAEGLLLVAKRQEMDFANTLSNPDKNNAEFLLTGGDIIVVVVMPDGNSKNSGCSIEFSEEI